MSREIRRFRGFSAGALASLATLTPRRRGLHTAAPARSPPPSEKETPP
jgi:hypothetical protein